MLLPQPHPEAAGDEQSSRAAVRATAGQQRGRQQGIAAKTSWNATTIAQRAGEELLS